MKGSNRQEEFGFAQLGGVDAARQIDAPVVVVDGEQSIGRVARLDRVGDPSAVDPVALILPHAVLIRRLDDQRRFEIQRSVMDMPPVLRLLEDGRVVVDVLDGDAHRNRRSFAYTNQDDRYLIEFGLILTKIGWI